MSLLLLFPGGVSRGWVLQPFGTASWVVNSLDYKHLWSNWNTTTWGSFNSSGQTWNYLQGFTFIVNTSTLTTTWVKQTVTT